MPSDAVLAGILTVITQLASGDVRARVPVDATLPDDDVTAIAVGLNMLAEELQALTEGLEAAVDERTAELGRAQQQLAHDATHDYLTGLGNRRLLYQQLDRQLVRGLQSDALMLLDLDGFKEVNDTLGHNVGDAVLLKVAQRLTSRLSDARLLVRLGGDEFAAVVTAGAESDLIGIADRVLDILQEPVHVDGYTVLVTASIGIVRTSKASNADDLLRLADVAMYAAKARGKNRSFVYEEESDDRRNARQIEERLREAIGDGQLGVVYQPQVHARTLHLQAAQALARWPAGSALGYPPAVFLPVAERTRQMTQLGKAVLERVCVDAAQWATTSREPIRFVVSIAPEQLAEPDFPALVLRTLHDTGASPDMLEFEITEATLADCSSSPLQQLRGLGIRVAVDRFGTGISSLAALRRCPVDTLKIDRSFVAGVAQEDDGTVVRAILALGRALQLRVVAEGVETHRQHEELLRIGCTNVQGYLFGRPMSYEELASQWSGPRASEG